MSFDIINKININDGYNNLLIEGDNLKVMPYMLEKFKSKVDLIYIDPPYNTGKKMGKYKDNFHSHKEWCDFIRPRLELAKDFLQDSGLIFISIGEKEEAYLKILCDEIFEEKNRISTIIWQCKYTVANDKDGISNQIEYILVYAKDKTKIIINNDPLRKEYVEKTYKNIDNDPRGLWRGGVQLYKKKNKHSYTVVSPNGKKWTMPWNYSEEQWKNTLEKKNLLYWGKDGNSCPVKKVFLKNTKGIGIKNLWLGKDVGYTADGGMLLEKMGFDRNIFLYPKPLTLLKRILKIASNKESLVLDFFAGSGTTGHAILELNKEDLGNRKFILINNEEGNVCQNVVLPRLNQVISETGGDLTYLKLKE